MSTARTRTTISHTGNTLTQIRNATARRQTGPRLTPNQPPNGLLAQGRSRISIGEKLYISENTVRTYVKNIYAKLDIHSKQELLDRLEEQGLHEAGESKL